MMQEPLTNFLPQDAIRLARKNGDNTCTLIPLYSPDGREMELIFVVKADVEMLPNDGEQFSVTAGVLELSAPEVGNAYVFQTVWQGTEPGDEMEIENVFLQSDPEMLTALQYLLKQNSWRFYFTDNWAMNLYTLRIVENRIAPSERQALIANIERLIAEAGQANPQ